ncbi:TipJ family phage tail tip protein [Pseudomonas sp. C5pp]|uniref:TipJ family phage tail tip protein n=1 Tax=Pseudomonas sp. C5pp TaxID=1586081 RepID=UPI00068B3F2E|nr:DUF1983 domain-containing protein [Pseudomonas sp. C5pp]
MAEAERKPTPRKRKAAASAPKATGEGKPTAKRVARRSGAVTASTEAKAPVVPKPARKPQVQGRKGGAEKVHTPVEAPDSVRSVARAKLLFALGEGEWAGNLDGRRIFLDGTPLIAVDGTENFPGVKWEFRPGTQHQEYIPGLPAVENETSVGVELRSDTPWVRSLTNPELSAARVRLSWPTLQERLSNGDVVGYRIDYAIDLAVHDGGWQEVLTATLNDKTTSKYERSHRIDLPKSTEGWSLRVRRLTPNSENKNEVADTMRVEAITEVIDAKLRYPNTALLYIEFDASQFQNIPKVSVEADMRVIRVPNNYDPASRTYTGIWDGTFKWAFTDNPAWVLYDLILNKRFGLGRRLDMTKVDRWELYEIARYCDERVSDGKGGQEPRFTCNVYIQSRADAWTVIRDIAAIFRGISYWSGSEMVFQADKPSDVEFVFSRSNVTEGKFQYTGQSERTRYSSALVSWDNPDNAYESEPEPVSIPALIRRYNFNQTEITAIGCTRQSEANRRGRWLLLTNSVDRGVTFSTGLEGYIPKPGRIIGVADALLAGRQLGGRISSAAGRQLTLDRNVQIKAGDRLIVNLPSGKAEARTVQAVAGRTVTVTADFSEPPRAQAQWGIESSDLVIQQYRVTKVSRSGSTFTISGMMNDPGKYDQVDSGTRLESRPISVVPARTQQAPEGVKLSSYTRTEQGLAVTTLRAEWQAAPGATAYSAEWRKDSGAWIAAPRSSALGFEVPGIYAGRYTVRVRAINPLEVSSLPAYSDETVLSGKEGAPPALASFTASPLPYAIGLAWTFPAGADDTRYVEVQQNQQGQETGAQLLGMYPYPQRGYELTGLAPGIIKFFRARLVDTSGNVGPWTSWLAGRSSSDASEYLELVTEDIVKGALGQDLFKRIDLIDGPPTMAGSVAQRVAAEALQRSKDLATEAQTRTQKIDAEAAARAQGLLAEAQARGTAMTAEATARQSGDQALTQKIEVLTATTGDNAAAIQAEKTARTNADSAMAGQIDTLAANTAANTAAIGTEATARTTADSALAEQIATVRAQSGGFDTALNYGFATTAEGWTGTNCTLAVENGRLSVTPSAASYCINSPVLALKGREQDRIRCRITRRAGSGWLGQVTYATAGHSSSTAYRKVIPNPGLAVGQSVVLDWDMSQLTAGGDDWVNNTITQLYLWLGNTTGDVFEVDWIAAGQVAPSASVASVTDERTARISADEANAAATTALGSSLTTTNQNVTAAQQAAQAAATAAGAKGEVIYGSTAPAADKRLAQNIWIDTTGNANTPKRWTGTAWVAVTDKVATDAAAAAASALAKVDLKADATALQALDTEVKGHGTTLTSQSTALTQLTGQIGNVGGDNLLANSSFEELATAARAKYWNVGATVAGTVTSMVDSPLAQSTKAQRVEHPALPAGGYVDLAYGGDNVVRPKARPGAQYALSVFARGTPGVAFRQYLQFRDAAGAVLSAPVALHTLTADYGRFVLLATAPADTVSVTVWAGRVLNGGSTTVAVWSEMDNVQFQEGAVATAYGPSTEQAAASQATAMQAITARVEQNEAGQSSQGAALTKLENNLTVTNQNVGTAQQAAQAAATAAGAKGEVIYGTAAPAADKRLAQNLWIDATGNANTPKRWNGSAWLSVTDKVATDAAAAAASALTQVATKAEAAALQAVSTTVGQHGDTLTSHGQSLNELRNNIGAIGAGGLDAAPGGTWQFDAGVEGWTATNATLAAGTGSVTITATANDPNLVSPIVSINGALYNRIKMKITRKAGAASDWDSSLFYQTAGHGFAGGYIARTANPNIAVGESAIVEWDMANLFAGGNDWVTSTITRLRIDVGALSGGAFEIDWIAVGRQGPGASSVALQQVSSSVQQQGEQLSAHASRLDGLYVQVNPEMEGDSTGMAGATGSLVGVWTEQSARIEDGIAIGRQVEAMQAQMGNANASVQQVSEVMADINGRVSAQTTVKVETNQNGRKVVSGIAIGSNGEEGEILLMAQRVAFIDGLNGNVVAGLVVENGQVMMNTALISKAFIQELVAGLTIRSETLNAQGLPLLEVNFKAGTFTLRGQDANGSTLLNNGGLYVYDANGVERTAVGRMT